LIIVEEGRVPLPEGLHVTWDRGIDEGYGITIYGWIDRKDQIYKDFLILTIMKKDQSNGTKKGEIVWWATSSVFWSEKINDLWNPGMGHNPCVKYDEIMEVLNA